MNAHLLGCRSCHSPGRIDDYGQCATGNPNRGVPATPPSEIEGNVTGTEPDRLGCAPGASLARGRGRAMGVAPGKVL